MAFVAQAREWLNEDINNSSEKKDLVNDSLNKCIDVVKNTLAKEQCKIVLNDLVEIGMADGEYDESEKGWVKMISDRLNIEPPTVENFSDKSGQNKNQDTGFPAIVIKKFEDNNKQKAFENFLKR